VALGRCSLVHNAGTADNQLRARTAPPNRLIGRWEHPLTGRVTTQTTGRVVEGSGCCSRGVTHRCRWQRRVSLFQRPWALACAASNLYGPQCQTCTRSCRAGLLRGKGIYEIDFPSRLRSPTGGRIRRWLSHDLFEGVCARAVSPRRRGDEEFPARATTVRPRSRHNRWARWATAIVAMIFGRGTLLRRGPQKDGRRGAITAIGRWKRCRNLRRTVVGDGTRNPRPCWRDGPCP